jgi:hypothetical protein
MFVQVIKGRAKDAAAVLAQGEKWDTEVRPGAIGHRGGTFGVSDDGTLVVVARFEDEAAANANSQRPEQSAWWSEMEPLLEGVTFRGSSDTSTLFGGPSDKAGFVQIMEGTAPDRAKAEALETPELEARLKEARPDLLGSLRVWFDGGDYVEAAYFTSEEEARKGESSGDFEGDQAEMEAMFGSPTYIDLKDPRHS